MDRKERLYMQNSISIYIALLDNAKREKQRNIYSVGVEPGQEPNQRLTPVILVNEADEYPYAYTPIGVAIG